MRYLDSHSLGGRAVWVMHRRAGKDLTAMHQTCKMAHRRIAAYWHIMPTMEQGRRSLWTDFTRDGERIMEQVFPSAIRKSPRTWAPNAEMVVELKCGSIWRLMGSDKLEVVGAGPAGVVFSEFALAKPDTWNYVRPMLRERDGWAAFISTPRGKNHLWNLWEVAGRTKGWWRDRQTLFDTRAYDPELTIQEERDSGMPEALINQEYLCDWESPLVGSVYGDLLAAISARGDTAQWDPETDGVHTSWDLGISDSTAIWWWRLDRDSRNLEVLDYHEANGKPFSHFAEIIEAKPYRYAQHWLPHDARARTLQTGASTVELAVSRFGAAHVSITPELSLADGIQATRRLLQGPIRFHPRCLELGLEALKAYRYAWDSDKKILSRVPVHDWSSHGADAFRYLACAAKPAETFLPPKPREAPPSPRPVNESYTLDALWDDRARALARED